MLSRVVAITGCDSGLGWAMAARAAREGLITVAGIYKEGETPASKALTALCAHTCPLDVTSQSSVENFKNYVAKLLMENPNYKLYAVVNNAGVMTIGDYEWQTSEMIERPVAVNLLGSMRVVSAFLPELRKIAIESVIKPRIINVASHCGLHPLPGFGPYSASKAGVIAWTRALRMELQPYGLSVSTFIPGGFFCSSNLMSNQIHDLNVMLQNLNEEQQSIYGKKLTALKKHLLPTSQPTTFDSLKDENIIETFSNALNADYPKEIYKVESLRYKFYYSLMNIPLPEKFQNYIIKKFLKFPSQ